MYLQKVLSRKKCVKKLVFCWHLEGQWRKYQDPDPDPLVRGMDPRIRIHPKMSWIRNTGKMWMKKMLNEENQIHSFISSSDSGTVINYGSGSGSDFLTSYGFSSGSGSTSQKVTVPTVLVPVPQRCSWTSVMDPDWTRIQWGLWTRIQEGKNI